MNSFDKTKFFFFSAAAAFAFASSRVEVTELTDPFGRASIL